MITKFSKYILFSLCSLLFSCNITFAQMTWNQAAKFTGPNTYSYISIPNSSDLTNVDECMIGMWVCLTAGPGAGHFLFLEKGNTDYRLGYSSSGFYARVGNVNTAQGGQTDINSNISFSLNRWYHVALIVRDTTIPPFQHTKVREIYVNGAVAKRDWQLFNAGTLGNDTDSLFIGGSGLPNFAGMFSGYIDDVNMFLGKYYPDDVARNFRTALNAWGNSNNYYYKCNLSFTFQDDDNSGSPFLVDDVSRYNHTVKSNNITAFSMSSRPSVTCHTNLSVHFNGSTDYIAGPDHLNNSPDAQITMEAWVYPEKIYNGGFSDFGTILFKGAASPNYRMYLGAGNSVLVAINGNTGFAYPGDITAPINQWTHIAFCYSASTGNYYYYLNGVLVGSGTNSIGNIVNGTDSLYIGQSNGGNFFQGYIDEVRISGYTKTASQIREFLYKSMDLGNRPSAFELSCYNFDGNLTNNNGHTPRLYFRNGAVFSSRFMPAIKNFPVSPMIKIDNFNFPAAWYINNDFFRVPAANTFGSSKYDTINIPYCLGITDVNVFLALNHTYEQDLTVYLISPFGDSIPMVKNNTMERGQFVAMFSDEADSSIINDRYTSFLPQIKPFTAMKPSFFDKNMKGDWKLRVNDGVNGDTGMVYAWGLQFNGMSSKPNLMTCAITANPGGFWGGSSQPLDTVRYILHRNVAPYDVLDSAIGYTNQFGFATTYLASAFTGSYYIEIRHRNSLAVWSSTARSFTQGGSTSFNILAGGSTVYGGDLISVNGRWCMYSGDINQDGAINGNDFTVFNQHFGLSGYVNSDLNGDGTVNGNDFTVFNTGFGHQTNHP